MAEIKAAKFAVYHHNCWGSYTTEKFPEISLRLVSPVTFLKMKGKFVDYDALWEATAPDAATLERYLAGLKGLNDVYNVDIIRKAKLKALFLLRVKSPLTVMGTVLKHHGIVAEPVTIEKGLEVHSVVSPDPDGIKKMLEELSDLGEVKVLRMGAANLAQGAYPLTEKQVQAIRAAVAKNYYSWPRKVTLEELADSLGMKRRAFQENLRKAEAKVFPRMIDELLSQSPVSSRRKSGL